MFKTDLDNIKRMIDISAVRTDVTLEELDMVIDLAIKNNLICAFAMPCFTSILVERLSIYKDILVGGVIGFPSGADTTDMKVNQVKEMLGLGVDELDMVINVGAMKSMIEEGCTRFGIGLLTVKKIFNTEDIAENVSPIENDGY